MKKLWPLILTMVMVIASCDKYSEGEYEPIYVHDISVNGNSVTIRANVNETYLNLYGFEVGAVCGTSSDVFRGQYDAIHADVSHYNERGGYLFELYDLPSGACYIRPYVYNEQNGTGKYNEAIRVEISGIADPVDEAGFRDLSYHESANCYIVSQEGRYKFKAVKGNSDERLDVYSADVLWESFGTDIAPSAGDLIPYVEYADFNQDGYFEIHFCFNAPAGQLRFVATIKTLTATEMKMYAQGKSDEVFKKIADDIGPTFGHWFIKHITGLNNNILKK